MVSTAKFKLDTMLSSNWKNQSNVERDYCWLEKYLTPLPIIVDTMISNWPTNWQLELMRTWNHKIQINITLKNLNIMLKS